jgi:Trk-type K+ transport system membrane component
MEEATDHTPTRKQGVEQHLKNNTTTPITTKQKHDQETYNRIYIYIFIYLFIYI